MFEDERIFGLMKRIQGIETTIITYIYNVLSHILALWQLSTDKALSDG